MRLRTTAAAAAAAAAALPGLAGHATGAPADRPGVRLYDEALGRTREDGATVCTFHVRAEGFAPGRAVNWTVAYAGGEDAVAGTLVTGDGGTGSSDRVVLTDGAYRFRWAGSAEQPRRFTVACPDGTATPAPAPPSATAAAPGGPGAGPPGEGASTASAPSGPSGAAAGVAAALAALCVGSIAALVMRRRRPGPTRRHRRVSG
ncbi:hypothetical protein PV392_22785 [Streptomyces sp. ME03-5709C]|nr:hypothetical protein [Streptomyces sp. ME03-5709C]